MTTNQDRNEEGGFDAVTTTAARRRHWKHEGRWRLTLCGQDSVPVVFEQERAAIAALPPCKQCDKSKARRIEGRKS